MNHEFLCRDGGGCMLYIQTKVVFLPYRDKTSKRGHTQDEVSVAYNAELTYFQRNCALQHFLCFAYFFFFFVSSSARTIARTRKLLPLTRLSTGCIILYSFVGNSVRTFHKWGFWTFGRCCSARDTILKRHK